MLPFYRKVRALSQAKVTGLGLSVFRIFISIILIIEVGKLFYFRHLYFDPVPYIVEAELSFSLVLLGWLVVLICGLFIGFKTKFAAIVNYVLVLVFFSSFTSLKYHFDSALIGISFLLIILPVNTRLSLDSLFYKLKTLDEQEQKVRQIYYFVPVLLVLGLQYFDSFFHKGASITWLNGLGVWLPASLPDQVYTNQSWLLNQKEVIMGLGYFVLLFEASFLFLLLVKKARIWVILVGVCMHLGIALVFPIPTFGVTFAGMYMLLIPVRFWEKLAHREEKPSKVKPVLFFHSKDLLAYRAKIVIGHFDVFRRLVYSQPDQLSAKLTYLPAGSDKGVVGEKAMIAAMYKTITLLPLAFFLQQVWLLRKGKVLLRSVSLALPLVQKPLQKQLIKANLIYFFILYLFVGQFIKTLNSPLLIKLSHTTSLSSIRDSLGTLLFPVAVVNTKLLGVTENLIYTGFEESTYEILGIEYVDSDGARMWLPLNEKNGMAAPMNFGRVGAIVLPNNPESTRRRLVSITSFWANKHNISLEQATFNILAKQINVQFSWQKDYLNRQLDKPWHQVGQLIWKGNEPFLTL